MKHWLVGAALVVCASAAWAADAPQQVIDERVSGMKKMGADMTVASKTPTAIVAQASLTTALAFAESIPSRFPKGTGIGDPGVTKTRALQDIWAKPAEFKAAADALVAALKVARDAAGDKTKLDAALAAVGKSCGGCHKPFRGPETE
jgi:cytochrome c556